jgi:hypothetical protein
MNVNVTDEKRQKFHFVDKTTGKQVGMETVVPFGLKANFLRILQTFFLKNEQELFYSRAQLERNSTDINRVRLLKSKIRDIEARQVELFEEILEWKIAGEEAEQNLPYLPDFQKFLTTVPLLSQQKTNSLRMLYQVREWKKQAKENPIPFHQFLTELVLEQEDVALLKDLAKLRGYRLSKIPENVASKA